MQEQECPDCGGAGRIDVHGMRIRLEQLCASGGQDEVALLQKRVELDRQQYQVLLDAAEEKVAELQEQLKGALAINKHQANTYKDSEARYVARIKDLEGKQGGSRQGKKGGRNG